MITKLDNFNEEIAKQIYTVFQRSYKIEAELIGTLNFPPLLRSIEDIQISKSQFYGFNEQNSLAAVIEIVFGDKHLDIHSLTVSPEHFRKGIADKLLYFILEKFDFTTAVVETAVVNIPAINLYQKHGFVECKRWTPSHGIEKLHLIKG